MLFSNILCKRHKNFWLLCRLAYFRKFLSWNLSFKIQTKISPNMTNFLIVDKFFDCWLFIKLLLKKLKISLGWIVLTIIEVLILTKNSDNRKMSDVIFWRFDTYLISKIDERNLLSALLCKWSYKKHMCADTFNKKLSYKMSISCYYYFYLILFLILLSYFQFMTIRTFTIIS